MLYNGSGNYEPSDDERFNLDYDDPDIIEFYKQHYYPQCNACNTHVHPTKGEFWIDEKFHPDYELFYCLDCIKELKQYNNENNN